MTVCAEHKKAGKLLRHLQAVQVSQLPCSNARCPARQPLRHGRPRQHCLRCTRLCASSVCWAGTCAGPHGPKHCTNACWQAAEQGCTASNLTWAAGQAAQQDRGRRQRVLVLVSTARAAQEALEQLRAQGVRCACAVDNGDPCALQVLPHAAPSVTGLLSHGVVQGNLTAVQAEC